MSNIFLTCLRFIFSSLEKLKRNTRDTLSRDLTCDFLTESVPQTRAQTSSLRAPPLQPSATRNSLARSARELRSDPKSDAGPARGSPVPGGGNRGTGPGPRGPRKPPENPPGPGGLDSPKTSQNLPKTVILAVPEWSPRTPENHRKSRFSRPNHDFPKNRENGRFWEEKSRFLGEKVDQFLGKAWPFLSSFLELQKRSFWTSKTVIFPYFRVLRGPPGSPDFPPKPRFCDFRARGTRGQDRRSRSDFSGDPGGPRGTWGTLSGG